MAGVPRGEFTEGSSTCKVHGQIDIWHAKVVIRPLLCGTFETAAYWGRSNTESSTDAEYRVAVISVVPSEVSVLTYSGTASSE